MHPTAPSVRVTSATFVSALVKYGLVDEYHMFINPVTLASGMTIFKGLAGKHNLALKRSLAFPCGIVLLCYELKPAA
jgi:dihydrofolate reductase